MKKPSETDWFWLVISLCVVTMWRRRVLTIQTLMLSPLFLGGTSPVQAVAVGLNHATTGAAGKAINGIKVAYHQSGLSGKVSSSLVTTQQPTGYHSVGPHSGEIYHSDTDLPPKKVRPVLYFVGSV